MKIKQIVKYAAAPVVGFALPLIALAQNSVSDGLGNVSGSFGFSSPLTQSQSVSQLATQIINIMLLFAGIVAVFFIIIGGYRYITAQGNAEQAEQGRTTVVNAIIG